MSDPTPFPRATIPVRPFTISHPDSALEDLRTLIRLSPLAPDLFENDPAHERKYGVDRAWMAETRDAWLKYDWREDEAALNKLPQYIARVPYPEAEEGSLDVHFIAHISSDPAAIPLLLLHGWPGSFLEFIDILPLLQKSNDPPLSIIVPSHVGYAYSSRPPAKSDFGIDEMAEVQHRLMVGLGLGGYVAQGGDLGSYVSRVLGSRKEECIGVHLNFFQATEGDPPSRSPPDAVASLTERDKAGLARGKAFRATGSAYATMHGTRPATIGYALASSPIALMAWVGEKILSWPDPSLIPSQRDILRWLTLYWLTQTFPSSIYAYRSRSISRANKDLSAAYVDKPLGVSAFPYELMPWPRAWAEGGGRVVHYKQHERGGHFAAIELPQVLADDIIEYLRVAFGKGGRGTQAAL